MNAKDIISNILTKESDTRILDAAKAISGTFAECDGKIFSLTNECDTVGEYHESDISEFKNPVLIKNYFKGGAVIAAFNLASEKKERYVGIRAIDAGLKNKGGYIYTEFFSGDFGYVNGDEEINIALDDNDRYMYFTFIEKNKKSPLFLGRIDKFNPRLAIVNQTEDTVELYEGGDFAFISDEDYAVFDECGNEVECERFGIFVSGTVAKENQVLKFVKSDI